MANLILLDRDGVINRDSDAFVKSADEFIPLPGAIQSIARLHKAGFTIGVCTNQSGIGRGLLTEETLAAIHNKLDKLVQVAGGRIDGIRYCPHLPDAQCGCRKPEPGMLLELMSEFGVGPENTTFVGDSIRDLEAADAAGCRAVLVRTGNGAAVEKAARQAGFEDVHEDLESFVSSEISRLQAVSGVQQ